MKLSNHLLSNGKKAIFLTAFSITSVAAFQSYRLRQNYIYRKDKLEIPIDFPTTGKIVFSTLKANISQEKLNLTNKLMYLNHKFDTENSFPTFFLKYLKEKQIKDILGLFDTEEIKNNKRKLTNSLQNFADTAEKVKKNIFEYENLMITQTFDLLIKLKKISNDFITKSQKPVNLIFLGDSLVCGTGCNLKDSKMGPG
jgi:hypothetical protein